MIEKYMPAIKACIASYTAEIPDPEWLYSSPATFTGLLHDIYLKVFKGVRKDLLCYRSIFCESDLPELEELFELYVKLCTHYKHVPTILRFCTMVGLDSDHVMDILHGCYPGSVSSATMDVLKRWQRACENGLYDRVAEQNSIGSMFLLKTQGYKEAAQELVINTSRLPQLSRNDVLSLTDAQDDA